MASAGHLSLLRAQGRGSQKKMDSSTSSTGKQTSPTHRRSLFACILQPPEHWCQVTSHSKLQSEFSHSQRAIKAGIWGCG